jgi:di/tricarboxylate transporter
MSKIDWTTFLFVGFLVVFMLRLDRLGRQFHYGSYRIRREMAELLGKTDRANELKEAWDQDEKEQRKEKRREVIGLIIISVVALAWWFASQPT